MAVQTYSVEELRPLLSASFGLALSPSTDDWSIETVTDADGWVTQVKIGERILSGDEWVGALSIRSVCFRLEIDAKGLLVTTWGEGSGCGLSRKGAGLYAKSGLSAEEILAHYYPRCQITAV